MIDTFNLFSETQSAQNKMMDTVDTFWTSRKGLQESLDVLEVYDFVYDFLLRQTEILDTGTYKDWFSGARNWFHPAETEHDNLPHTLKTASNTLNPADVLGMMALSSRMSLMECQPWSQEAKWQYFRARGTRSYGRVGVRDVTSNPDFWYPPFL
jgi:hypothetical protein